MPLVGYYDLNAFYSWYDGTSCIYFTGDKYRGVIEDPCEHLFCTAFIDKGFTDVL